MPADRPETCPYCMQRADRCACEDPRIVGYENAPPTPPAPAVRHWQHDETGRVCDCVDCPGPRYHEVNEAFAEAHEKAMREKCGAPAPADDAREKGLAAYDALNMREKSEIAAQHPRYCYAKGYVAALAGRADDASGAEAMGGSVPAAQYRAVVRAFDALARGDLRALGTVHEDIQGSVDAIVARLRSLPLPARDDAVEEARRAFYEAARLVAAHNVAVAVERGGTDAGAFHLATRARDKAVERMQRAYAALVNVETYAALRPEKEFRSDDSRPASGQGGA